MGKLDQHLNRQCRGAATDVHVARNHGASCAMHCIDEGKCMVELRAQL